MCHFEKPQLVDVLSVNSNFIRSDQRNHWGFPFSWQFLFSLKGKLGWLIWRFVDFMSRPDPPDCLADLRSIFPFSLKDPDTSASPICFHIPTLLFPRAALTIFVPFHISLIHVVSNRIHACLNHSVTVFTEVHRAETFQRLRICLPASMGSVQCAGLSRCLQRHYWGLLRHDPQRHLNWNEGEQNKTRAQFGLFSFHITPLNLGSANWSRIGSGSSSSYFVRWLCRGGILSVLGSDS